ncbi:MAG: histidine kinase [Gemmatimonadota bacterium]
MSAELRGQWAVALLLWSVPALLFTVPALGRGEPLGTVLLTESMPWLYWALVTPLVLAQARRHPIEAPRRRRALLVHAATGALAGVLFATVNVIFFRMLGAPTAEPGAAGTGFLRMWAEAALVWTPMGLIFYAAIASVGFALAYQQRLAERDLHAARLEAQLGEARLQALRNQLDPHFLFNTLNTVAMHVRADDKETSVGLLARLSELLRHMLEEERAAEVPLRTEMQYVKRYLEIEGARFGDRLTTRVRVPESVLDAHVPNLLLQPLVENAIRHGIAAHPAAGTLVLWADRRGDRLHIEVLNDGAALADDFSLDTTRGVGIRNTRARLTHLYNGGATFRLENRGGGVAAVVELPWRT